jgi:hypothetical protein
VASLSPHGRLSTLSHHFVELKTQIGEIVMTQIAERISTLPDHLMQLENSQWALWHCVVLRGAGFPADLVKKLSAPNCAAIADRLLLLEADVDRSQNDALKAVNALLDELSQEEKSQRKQLLQAIHLLKKGKIPTWSEDSSLVAVIGAFEQARECLSMERENFDRVFQTDTTEIFKEIQQLAQNERLREAIIWQNRRVLHNAIDPLLRIPLATYSRNSYERKFEQLFAMYLQRYCVKNDTIGFFGPVAWGNFMRQGERLVVQPGQNLLESRSVGFESWCIESLANILSQDRELRPWMAPRTMPFIRVEGTTLYVPRQEPCEISREQAIVLQVCNGERTAQKIANIILQDPSIELNDAEAIYSLLGSLQELGLITWTLEIPVIPNAEKLLWSHIEQIENEQLRHHAKTALEKLESCREDVIKSAGDAEKLDRAIGELEDTFTNLTNIDATRSGGQTYAGRTLVYEDCRRDLKVELGPDLLKSLGSPLSLLLTSARWLTYQTAIIYRRVFSEVYSELANLTKSSAVDLLTFWSQVEPIVMDEKQELLVPVLKSFKEKWAEILGIPASNRHVSLTSDELRAKVIKAFDAPHSGWQVARYHSPDVMIDAASVDAIQRGDYQFVLGEMHLAAIPFLNPLFSSQHSSPEQLFGYYERDIPDSFLIPLPHKQWPGLTTRFPLVLALPKDYVISVFPDACAFDASQVIPISQLVVEEIDGNLMIRTRDRNLKFDIIEVFSDILGMLVLNAFKILPIENYLPRIAIDRLVIQRESWKFNPAEIDFVREKNEVERFVAVRRWMQFHQLPAQVFVKTPVEVKPFYVDFDSPIYVDLLTKIIRKTIDSQLEEPYITFSEMLPDRNGIWLPDAENHRYTSEFRILALDLAGK